MGVFKHTFVRAVKSMHIMYQLMSYSNIYNIIRNNFGNDDLVLITDTSSMLNNKPYQYVFSRKNRAPALYYIRDNELEFSPSYEITEEDLARGLELRKAEDPDEDSLNYSIKILPFLTAQSAL